MGSLLLTYSRTKSLAVELEREEKTGDVYIVVYYFVPPRKLFLLRKKLASDTSIHDYLTKLAYNHPEV